MGDGPNFSYLREMGVDGWRYREAGDSAKIGRLPMGDGRSIQNHPVGDWEILTLCPPPENYGSVHHVGTPGSQDKTLVFIFLTIVYICYTSAMILPHITFTYWSSMQRFNVQQEGGEQQYNQHGTCSQTHEQFF